MLWQNYSLETQDLTLHNLSLRSRKNLLA